MNIDYVKTRFGYVIIYSNFEANILKSKLMEQSKIDLFVSTMNEKFAATNMMAIRSQLEELDDSKFSLVQSLNYKNPTTLLIVSLFNKGLEQ